MSVENIFVLASFTAPKTISTTPWSMLWLLPLTVAIAIVYKTTKLSKITTGALLKEVAVLFGSIIIFIAITALVLYGLSWLITG